MRIVLQHQRTSRYLRAPSSWVTDALEATDFHNAIRALSHCVLHRIEADVVPVLDERDGMAPPRGLREGAAKPR